ncbi:Prolyl oligopeptidase family protein [Rhynchospora pubera]|uniref:Prolyl endopeptidase n=1 Tax=Rhynchospora pubera TaxID=906938 RepID=A0AAV8EVQ2_9POAL|nr:Prolyl oligopeptidase family protein [Rhynchospora pubera]
MLLVRPPQCCSLRIALTRRLFFSSLPPFLLSSSAINPTSTSSLSFSPPFSASASMTTSPTPPVAKKVPHRMELFGDVRVDNYYWLRDDSRADPEVLSHLKAENEYTSLVMSDVKPLVGEIYAEMRARIKEDDISAPVRKGSFYYYVRTLTGKEYSQYCRRFVPTDAPPSVEDVMPTGPDAPAEHVILDKNVKAEGHDYYSIGAFEVSPNNKMVAYAEDTKGDEIYLVHVIDAESGKPVEQPLKGITSNVEWANDEYIVYVTMDEILRPDKVWLHKLGTDQSSDTCLYHEKNDMFSVDVTKSASKQYLFVGSESKNTRFVFYLDVSKLENGLLPLTPRVYGIDTTVDHRGDHFFITRRSEQCYNSELVICPVDNVSDFTLLLPHRESVKIQNFHIFKNHIALCEREHGLPEITVYSLPPIGEPIRSLENGRRIEFVDPAYDVGLEDSEYNSRILRFSYSSMKTPLTVYDYDMETGASAQKKIQAVLGGFDASNYVTERQWAVALDGTRIPISILYRKNQVKLDGSDPLLLYGYGSYEVCIEADFSRDRLTLVDRGFIYAIAHIRGGGEMGRKWYENGKLTSKKNTFTDFITCAEYLLEKKYGSPQKLCIDGRSAGGLLISSVVNMRPDLFKAAILGVPFVDVVTTMLDPTIPLTTSEWEEWGDPRKEEFYYYMKSYSPVDNVEAKDYPHMLVTAGLNDPRVMYSEPAKYVAKLREMKTNNNLLLFKCELGAGHFSKSGRFERLQEDAFIYAFVLKALDLIPKASL